MFIEGWHKKWSVWLAALAGALATAYDYLPAAQQYLPEGWFKYAAAAILVARVIKQNSDKA